MDYKSLTSLMLRLTGVIIVVSEVTVMPRTFINLHARNPLESPDVAALLLTIVASGLPILIGLLLIYFPAAVANKIVSAGGESVDRLNLQQLAFSVLGLYFVSLAVFDAVYWLAKLRIYFVVYNELNFGQPFRLTPEDFAGIAATCAQFVAGLLLLFGGRGLANLVHRLRSPPAVN
jgi:hypothetical protein